MSDTVKHEDGEVLKCTECLEEDNPCPYCGDYLYDGKVDDCPSCEELMSFIVDKYNKGDER